MAASDVFSVRIVSVDYYMAAPIPDLDISYSSFQGGKVNQVPVIRVFGSTPAGQKTCLHIHRALPYLYVPCSDVPMELHQKGDSYTHDIALAIEKALKLKGNAGSKRQHVHGCSLVQARKLYGYHSSEELFVKLYLYYPHDVSRAANLLLGGSILGNCLQPHESHIPFILQFLVDYNLYGMGHLHVSKIKFRYPIPEVFSPTKCVDNGLPSQEIDKSSSMSTNIQAGILGQLSCSSPVWISSTIPVDWSWNSTVEFDGSNPDTSCVKRQSICELEGDATVDEILNQQLKMYTSLSQTRSDVKMVQSLIPIWEEFERTGIYEGEVPPDPAKPLPEDVLKTLSFGLEFNKKLMKVLGETSTSLCQTQSRKDVKLVQHMTSPDEGNSVGLKSDIIGGDAIGSQSTQDSTKDSEVLGLLRWLATSQAAHDLNSDDELACETILSPLLPATTIDKVLEKANVDYETESQKECQDILDSVGELMDFEGLKEQSYDPSDGNRSSESLYKHVIPQVDGSTDAISTTCDGSVGCNLEIEGKNKLRTSEHQELQDASASFNLKHKRKRLLWGSLPLSVTQKVKTEGGPVSLCRETKEPVGFSSENEVGKHADIGACDFKETSILDRCSVRDLMRRKRAHRVEPAESGSRGVKAVLLVMQDNENTVLCPKRLDFQMSHADELDQKPHGSSDSRPSIADQQSVSHQGQQSVSHQGFEYDVKPTNLGCSLFGKLPFPSSSENSLHANTIDKKFDSNVRYDKEVGTGATAQCENSLTTGPFQVPSLNTGLWLSKPERLISEAFLGCETREKSNVHSFKSGPEENLFADKRLQLIDASASSCFKSYAIENQVSGRDGYAESGLEGLSSTGGVCKMSFENPFGANVVSVTTALNNERFCGHKPSGDCFSSGIRNSPSEVIYSDDKDLISLTFRRKPPDAEWKEGEFQNASSLNGGRAMDDFLPYFVGDCQDETEIQNKHVRTSESGPHQESVMGVPIHYQTDGSYLYLLTPATTPPSPEDVDKWLSSENEGSSRSLTGLPSSLPNDWDNTLLEYGSLDGVRRKLPQRLQENHGNHGAENPLCNDWTETVQREGDAVKVQTRSECSLDGSQISGPDGKSKLTPLSQIGFRDPASIGGGQQMTLLCIEVQAESRGDLRPDPRFDAVNIISLAIQNDSDSGLEVHALLRSKPESSRWSLDGTSGCKVLVFHEEEYLFNHFMKTVRSLDPDVLMGWDIQGGSLGYLAERASHLGIGLLNKISRAPSETKTDAQDLEVSDTAIQDELIPQAVISDSVVPEDPVIEDEWGRTHASGVHVVGRIVLNVWRLVRGEVKLNMYTIEAVAQAVLRRKVPYISNKILMKWFTSGPGRARYRCIEYVNERVKLSLEIMNQLDMINRTSELARVFGIDFFSVLSRGSQYRVESMLLRLAHAQNYLAISPGNKQVASQPAMECIPLVMEPESGFYADPVVVLDFQSLYPSMIIAYNLCYSTCIGKVVPSEANIFGVSSFLPDPHDLHNLKDRILVTPNGVMYVPEKVRKGVLPRLLDEILSTRIMVKKAMKKLSSSQQVLHRIFNSRQLALKLISNVTYGYTAAGFSGRMPCAEIADSIVQCGRTTLEKAILYVNSHEKWKAKVIYGDTDSMFVLLKGRTIADSFQIGREIAAEITAMNPNPVALKIEKVYSPCFLLTKKRYVGYSYESPEQTVPIFDAKGIETVRRDTCGAVVKTMEQSLRLFFEHQDVYEVKAYLERQWKRILSGRVSFQDFVFAKEVRLGTYRASSFSSLPPAAIVASKAIRIDPRAEPRYAERIPYVVIHGEPGARLADMVVDPLNLLAVDSPYRLNDLYYIHKQIIPALQRVFGLVGADLNQWFSNMPRPARETFGKRPFYASNPHRTRIDYYYLSSHCILCGELVQGSARLCNHCSASKDSAAVALVGRSSKLEREMQHLAAICRHCGGGDWIVESGIKCASLACSLFYERRKVQKELQGLASVAAETGLYPKCMVEWF